MSLGPTGKFPQGQLTEHDMGELAMAIYPSKGKVILKFGTVVEWLGFSPKGARELAAALVRVADTMEGS